MLISPDNQQILTGGIDGILVVMDLGRKELLGTIENVHKGISFLKREIFNNLLGGVDAIAISRNHKYLVTGSYDQSIVIHDLDSYARIHCIENAHERNIQLKHMKE